MQLNNNLLKTIKIISIAIVVLFVVLSSFNCITVYEESCNHSQIPLGDDFSVYEPTINESEHNNQLLRVTIIGIIEIVLIIFSCYKLSIVVAIFEFLLTIGTLCTGLIYEIVRPIYGSVSQSTVSFEISLIGYAVLCIAILNLAMVIILQVKKRSINKGKTYNVFDTHPDYTKQN